MSNKQRFSSFSKRLTRRIMLALTLALIVVATSFNWIEASGLHPLLQCVLQDTAYTIQSGKY